MCFIPYVCTTRRTFILMIVAMLNARKHREELVTTTKRTQRAKHQVDTLFLKRLVTIVKYEIISFLSPLFYLQNLSLFLMFPTPLSLFTQPLLTHTASSVSIAISCLFCTYERIALVPSPAFALVRSRVFTTVRLLVPLSALYLPLFSLLLLSSVLSRLRMCVPSWKSVEFVHIIILTVFLLARTVLR